MNRYSREQKAAAREPVVEAGGYLPMALLENFWIQNRQVQLRISGAIQNAHMGQVARPLVLYRI